VRCSGCLTKHGHDDNDEVEDVPRFLEVVQAQRQQLHETLHREDADKHEVHVVKRIFERPRHVVVLERHGNHVEQDDDHDARFESLVGHQLEEEPLKLQLRVTKTTRFTPALANYRQLYSDLYHGNPISRKSRRLFSVVNLVNYQLRASVR